MSSSLRRHTHIPRHLQDKPYSHWQASLRDIIDYYNNVAAHSGKSVSFATQAARKQVLWQGFHELQDLGYRLKDVRGFREKHLKVLGEAWEARGLSASRLQNNISIFRTFCGWIGKPGMIRASYHYVSSPEIVTRSIKAQTDKTWSGQGVDVRAKLAEVTEHDERVAMVLKLQAAFGLAKRI